VKGLLAAFFVEVALVTYRDVSQGGIKVKKGTQSTAPLPAPLPSLYTATILLYGGLSLLPSSLAPLPSLVGWGVVVATWLNLYTPGSANAAKASNTALGSALGSNPTTGAPKAPARTK
jgi:hypothetical protein